MTRDKQQPIDLTLSQAAVLERFAAELGITPEQAATRLAQIELDARYRLRKIGIPQVLPRRR